MCQGMDVSLDLADIKFGQEILCGPDNYECHVHQYLCEEIKEATRKDHFNIFKN